MHVTSCMSWHNLLGNATQARLWELLGYKNEVGALEKSATNGLTID